MRNLFDVLVLLSLFSPVLLVLAGLAYRALRADPMDTAMDQFEDDAIELPTVDAILGNEQARALARQHIGSIIFDEDGFRDEPGMMKRHPITHSVISATRLDGGVQTLERRPWTMGDEHLSRAKQLAEMLGVEFREI